jgi:cytosine/adenosine deaminase-related metal-dependent hydrolase
MKATDMLNKVKELIGVELSEEVKLAQATLENGTVIESEDFAAGSEVFIVTEDEKVALPIGDYTLEDGEILVVEEEGIIASIGAAEEAPAEEEVEAQEEEMGYATKEELAEVKAMIEEIKSMLESKEEMSEESPNTIKSEETTTKTVYASEEEVELSAEPIAKITHNPEAETKRNLNLFAQKRPMTTADKVMQRIANIKK